jgi:hypothetical protein
MTTTAAKPWYESRTLWGAIVTAIAMIVQASGIEVPDAEQQRLIDLLTHLGEGFGLVLVIWGRIAARKRLTVSGGTGIALALALASMLGACDPNRDQPVTAQSPAQQAYLVDEQYAQRVQPAILAYVTSPSADPTVKARLQKLDARVNAELDRMWRDVGSHGWDASVAASAAARAVLAELEAYYAAKASGHQKGATR